MSKKAEGYLSGEFGKTAKAGCCGLGKKFENNQG